MIARHQRAEASIAYYQDAEQHMVVRLVLSLVMARNSHLCGALYTGCFSFIQDFRVVQQENSGNLQAVSSDNGSEAERPNSIKNYYV